MSQNTALRKRPDRNERMTEEPPDFMKYRMRLNSPNGLTSAARSYTGSFLVHQFRSLPVANQWLKKKTRGLLVFFFTSVEAAAESRATKQRQREAARAGECYAMPSPRHVYIPLEPGGMLWMSVPVNSCIEETVTEALWYKIPDEAIEILKWYTNFLDDVQLPLNMTVHHTTQSFVHDYNAYLASGESMGRLGKYTGMLKNDGGVHRLRSPDHDFPCIV